MARNQLSKGGAAGGPGSKSLAKTTIYHSGQPAQKINPGGVAQFGSAVGNHASDSRATTNYRGDPVRMGAMGGMGSVKLGNEVALNVGKGGPGSGRTVMRSGSQGGVSPATPIGPTKDTLAEFGPDSPNVAGRR